MEHPRRWLSDNPYHKCRICTTTNWCDKKRDMEFSRRWIAENAKYDMIIGRYLFPELLLDLCLSDYTIRLNGGAYKGWAISMRDMNNSYVWITSDLHYETSFRDEEIWECEHVLDPTRLIHRILGAKYQKSDSSKIVSNSKHLSNDEQSMLYNVLTKYELLFDKTLWICRTKPVNMELQSVAKPCHSNPYPVPWAREDVFCKEVECLCQIGVLKGEFIGVEIPHFYSTKK